MTSIFSYRKHIDAITTRELRLPEGENHQKIGTELATINGVTYISLPDGATLPAEQPAEIAASIADVMLTPELRAAISDASPHVRLIRQRVQDRIAERYSMADEIKLLRTQPSAEFEVYNAYAEDCRAWGRAERAKLGL
jgi:hypothetical protein